MYLQCLLCLYLLASADACVFLPVSVCVCVFSVCLSLCLSVCWANSGEIILPQSPCLSGQSDEGLVIFNTAGGGCSSIREAKLPVCECTSPSHFSLRFPSSGYSFLSVGLFQMARRRQMELFSRQCAHWRNVEINWTGPVMARYKVAEETMQTQLGLGDRSVESASERKGDKGRQRSGPKQTRLQSASPLHCQAVVAGCSRCRSLCPWRR